MPSFSSRKAIISPLNRDSRNSFTVDLTISDIFYPFLPLVIASCEVSGGIFSFFMKFTHDLGLIPVTLTQNPGYYHINYNKPKKFISDTDFYIVVKSEYLP